MKTSLKDSELFVNRELSWLEFNLRVLQEAQDPSQPLLERLRFLSITSSNLDEFFEVRVAGIKQLLDTNSTQTDIDGMPPHELFQAIREKTLRFVRSQYKLWEEDLLPALKKEGIFIHPMHRLKGEDLAWAKKFFLEEVYPVLTPVAIDASHPFPQILNKSHNLIIRRKGSQTKNSVSHTIVGIPRIFPNMIPIKRNKKSKECHLIYFKDLIAHFIRILITDVKKKDAHVFRITRNSELYIDEEEADNIIDSIQGELRNRNRGNVVRLEVEKSCPPSIRNFLLKKFKISADNIYQVNTPTSFLHLDDISSLSQFSNLRDRPFKPTISTALAQSTDIFKTLRKQEVLLHHPYESFESIINLLEVSAEDPNVLAIKITLYRTSGDSPVIRALIKAAQNSKQVTAIIEIKARFDEANNIQWARQLEEAGVHVIYGMVGLKTHCKMLLIVRRDRDKIRHYMHLGTGNYHPHTALFYSDLGLLTSNEKITSEVAPLFNTLTGGSQFTQRKNLLVAPFCLEKKFLEHIQREAQFARKGKKARIIAKMNSLSHGKIIRALYEASCDGVKIDLIVRGICCLRPGVPHLSENIRVISIVGRFLEHSRIFYFENNGSPKVYLGSADWMTRNLRRRIEVVFPILNPAFRDRIINEIIASYLNDTVKAREMKADGTYAHIPTPEGTLPFKAQLYFRQIARKEIPQKSKPPSTKQRIIPIRNLPS